MNKSCTKVTIRMIIVFCFIQLSVAASLCEKLEKSDNTSTIDQQLMKNTSNCADDKDSKFGKECCNDTSKMECCPTSLGYMFQVSDRVIVILAVCVISGCFALTIIISICCFCPSCPLYNACKVEYSPEIASYESQADAINMDSMPVELTGKGSKFTPVVISNGNLDADNNPL